MELPLLSHFWAISEYAKIMGKWGIIRDALKLL
jgi:hypothetical protein